jgi:hypothetical protein
MKIFANSIPKAGTHLLLRVLVLLDFELADFGGLRPRKVSEGEQGATRESLRKLLGIKAPGEFLGIGPHLVDGGRFPAARALLRTRGPEKVTVGVDLPREIGKRWLEARLSRVPDNCVVSAHCAYSSELAGVISDQKMRTVCIVRDPRDTAVSHMHYLKKLKKHPVHDAYMQLPDDHERLMVSIRGGRLGDHRMLSLAERYRNFLNWGHEGGAAVVTFEDLVGPKGGGTDRAQRAAIERVAQHLGVERSESELDDIQRSLFGSGRTFRKGRAGGWREEFSPQHRKAASEVVGDVLLELGYGDETDW